MKKAQQQMYAIWMRPVKYKQIWKDFIRTIVSFT